MSPRNLSAARGAGWIVDGFDIVKRNPAVFAGIGFVFGLLMSLPVLGLVISLFSALLYGGFVSALHTQASGGQPRLGQLFEAFGKPRTLLALAMITLLMLLVALLLVGAMVALVDPAVRDEFAAIAASGGEPDPAQLAHLAGLIAPLLVHLLWLVPLGLILNWAVFFAVPRAMLDGVSGPQALADGLRTVWSNLLPLLVNLLCWIVLAMVLSFALLLVGGVLNAAFGQQGFGAQVVSVLLGAVFGAVYVTLYCASMYQAWREVFGTAPASTAAASGDLIA